MAETAITTVLAKVAELVAWEAAVLLEVGDDVRLLRDKLEWLHTFIRDADRRRRLRDDEFVAVWVRQTRDVAFEAEDALDDFLHRAGRRRRRNSPPPALLPAGTGARCSAWRWRWQWPRRPRCAGLQVGLRHDLSARVRQIRKRLDEISANRAAYNIEHATAPAWAASSATTLAAWDDLEEYTVGFDKYSDMLREQLLDVDAVSGRALVSIVGESSIGKTTLARKVYQSPEVRNHFAIRTWTVLPPNSRPSDVLRDIHRQASSQLRRSPSHGQVAEDGSSCDAGAKGKDISNSLFRNMTGRRYLVVVDGSIAVADWNSLRASLPDEGNGSRVLLVTDAAGLEVVGYAGGPTYDPIELTRLSPENTYELFRRRVFGRRGDCPGRYKSRYYQDVFRITRGLPLSVVVLAGVLRSKELPVEWDQVMTQLLAARDQPQCKNGNGGRRIMSLAFDDLPHHLKSCFLYFAAMPESVPVDAARLVRLWVAEGFVRPRRGSTMEEVGQGYLKELISRCMVQLVDKDEFGTVTAVVVHDRLHAFAQDEAQEACFVESHDSTDVLAPATVRRLAVQNTTDKHVHLGNALPKLRTIVCDFVNGGTTKPSVCIHSTDLGFLHASKFLRVIDIHGLELKKLPNEIGSMIHIRYLGLQCGQLEKLPSTISKLVNLQSLILKGRNGALGVTAAFWTITTLRHVVAPFALPKCLGDLYSLQTLHGVQPHCWDTRADAGSPLGRATNLRSLELSGLTATHAGALTSALESLDLLVHLVLQGESLPLAVFTVPSLRRLQSLRLLGSMDEDEDEEADDVAVRYIRPNLTRLSMWGTMVGQSFVDMLGELPSLAELTLMWGMDLSSDEESLKVVVHAAESLFSSAGIDYMIHNAAFERPKKRVLEETEEGLKATFNVNVFGTITLTRLLAPSMLDRGMGHFVVMSSAAGKVPSPGQALYSASKHALNGYFASLRSELCTKGIKVTIVCPGPIGTPESSGAASSSQRHSSEKRVSVERCAELTIVAATHGLKEAWISYQPVLAVMYLVQYAPTIGHWLMDKVGAKRVDVAAKKGNAYSWNLLLGGKKSA